MALVFIALGSNLDSPFLRVSQAITDLSAHRNLRLDNASGLYRSVAIGPDKQPDYCNAVVQVTTALNPESLLDILQDMECQQGRIRVERWGPRTLDLDLLLYDDQCIESVRLTVPHERMHERAFVLLPLSELTPSNFRLKGQSIRQLLAKCSDRGMVEKIDDASAII